MEVVVLKGGVSVLENAWRLAINLEARGVRIHADGDELVVSPATLLTEDDCDRIQNLKSELLRIARYQPPVI